MDLIDTINSESWKSIYILSEENKKDDEHDTFVIVSEFTGGKLDALNREMSDRKDFILFIPMITINITNETNTRSSILKTVKSEFFPYSPGYLPSTFYCSENVKAELKESELVIKFVNDKDLKDIIVNLSEREIDFLKNCDSFSFAVIDGEYNYIRRIKFSNASIDLPEFHVKNLSIKAKNFNEILPSIIGNIDKLKKVLPFNLNTFLDTVGSSDYEVYQSTSSFESLPSLTNLNLGQFCYACGKQEVTREHCSPKWMTNKYKVKPLIGNIFCSECNGWFGENFEKAAEEKLKINSGYFSNEQRLFISKWCIKTALTMSLASGAIVDAEWLPKLKKGEFPDGIEVYFDNRYRFYENGFVYGISRFNKKLRGSVFLFSFLCKDFCFVVIKRNHNEPLVLPFFKFFPKFEIYKSNEGISNFTDFHQKLHELLSKEKTEDYKLPIRAQSKRD